MREGQHQKGAIVLVMHSFSSLRKVDQERAQENSAEIFPKIPGSPPDPPEKGNFGGRLEPNALFGFRRRPKMSDAPNGMAISG